MNRVFAKEGLPDLFRGGMGYFGLSRIAAFIAFFLAGAVALQAEGEHPPGAKEVMDYGPVIAESVVADWPEGNTAMKGLAIRLDHGAGMTFDTDLLRWSVGTRDGWIDISPTSHTRYRDQGLARTEGEEVFATTVLPGWAGEAGFEDPREGRRGNLPRDWAHYKGYYRYGDSVLLHYTAGEDEVLELPRALEAAGEVVFTRSLQLSAGGEHAIYLKQIPEGAEIREEGPDLFFIEAEGTAVAAGTVEAPVGAGMVVEDGRLIVTVPEREEESVFHLFIAEVESEDPGVVADQIRRKLAADPPRFDEMRRGGPKRWPEAVREPVTLSGEKSAYVVDRIGLPMENPWNAWVRPTGFDFFEDGESAAFCTWNGDVWIVSGLGEEMEEVEWRRFASGLYYPLGLAIVDETIYVTERSQLTRLHDLNGNGEADYYESFNNDSFVHPRAHALCLEVDSEGNFYFFKNGNRVPGDVPEHGALIRVPPDGSKREIFAYGIRGANTLAIGPGDMIMGADQQGNWVPTARVDRYEEGGYYGFPQHRPEGVDPDDFEPPVAWIPHRVDNSSGAMAYAGDGRWGPLAGNWTIGSYGQARLLLFLTETVGDRLQGGVVPFPLEFDSGLMRARMNPADGQLYLAGMKGWQTLGDEDGSFDRVRFTGEPSYFPVALNVSPKGGVDLQFSEPIAAGRLDVTNFEVSRWQYERSRRYGSPEYSVANPDKEGRDPVEVAGVTLSQDGRRVSLRIPDIQPVMVMKIGYRLEFADGAEVENAVFHTIHNISDEDVDGPERVARAPREGVDEPVVEDGEPMEEFDFDTVPEWFARGREGFENNCATCHQPAERAGVAPAMEESEWAAGSEAALIRIVLQGKIGDSGAMMPFGWLEDEEIADILSYIRVRWHDLEAISEEDVAGVREETEGRRELWDPEELREVGR